MRSYYVYTRRPGFGDWLDDLLTPSGVTAGLDAAKEVTAKLTAQCIASGGKMVGTQCEFPTGDKVAIPQPEDVVPGVTDVRAKVESTVANIAKQKAREGGTAGAKEGATQILVVGALIAVSAWLLLRR